MDTRYFLIGLAISTGVVGSVMNIILKHPQTALVWAGVGIIFALLAIAVKK